MLDAVDSEHLSPLDLDHTGRILIDSMSSKAPTLRSWICALTLLGLCSSLMLPLSAEAGHDHDDISSASHYENTPCPDADGSHPCSPACHCACCPGHLPLAAFGQTLPLCGHVACQKAEPIPDSELLPEEIVHRVFHPPRC